VEKIYTKVPNPYADKRKGISIISGVFGKGKSSLGIEK
jgi:hypothetical protein